MSKVLKTKLNPVKSSNIMAMGYNEGEKIMEVRFHSGSTYRYFDVDLDTYKAIKSAPSIGKRFNEFTQTKPLFEKI